MNPILANKPASDCNICSPVDRRSFLRLSVAGTLGFLIARSAPWAWAEDTKDTKQWAPAAPGAYPVGAAKAKNVILLWMAGGPSHLDTWDPKPGAKTGGPFKAIETRIPGAKFSEHLPGLAEVSDRLAVIRGMTSKEGSHQRATYLVHTGYIPQITVHHPSLGAIVAHEAGKKDFDLPNFISIGGPSVGGGYFGTDVSPFIINDPTQEIANLATTGDVNAERFDRRKALSEALDKEFEKVSKTAVDQRAGTEDKALRMMRTPLRKAFDLADEPESVRKAYGQNKFGQGCLMARRLVETGVKCVEVTLQGWDTHQDNFTKTSQLMGAFDPAFSMLIKDLSDRKLLDSTLIVWMGEFGRSPQINGNDGRDHHPRAWSAVLAGAGIRGGQVIGSTTPDGSEVAKRPVSVPDLYASFAHAFGIDAKKVNFAGPRPITLVDKFGKPVEELFQG